MNEMKLNKVILLASGILGLSLIIGISIFAATSYNARKLDDTLSVTGSAKQKVLADTVKWRSSFSRLVTVQDIKSGYAQMKVDENKVQKFFKDNGLSESEITISSVFMNEIYKSNDYSPKEYSLLQNVEVNSSDISKVSNLSKNIQPLIDQGVLFTTNSVEYYTSKLPELRVSLLADAIKDAKARAEKIAQDSGSKVGAIRSASMGIVQVLSPNSMDISDYGNYETSSVEKEVMVTVKAVFRLK